MALTTNITDENEAKGSYTSGGQSFKSIAERDAYARDAKELWGHANTGFSSYAMNYRSEAAAAAASQTSSARASSAAVRVSKAVQSWNETFLTPYDPYDQGDWEHYPEMVNLPWVEDGEFDIIGGSILGDGYWTGGDDNSGWGNLPGGEFGDIPSREDTANGIIDALPSGGTSVNDEGHVVDADTGEVVMGPNGKPLTPVHVDAAEGEIGVCTPTTLPDSYYDAKAEQFGRLRTAIQETPEQVEIEKLPKPLRDKLEAAIPEGGTLADIPDDQLTGILDDYDWEYVAGQKAENGLQPIGTNPDGTLKLEPPTLPASDDELDITPKNDEEWAFYNEMRGLPADNREVVENKPEAAVVGANDPTVTDRVAGSASEVEIESDVETSNAFAKASTKVADAGYDFQNAKPAGPDAGQDVAAAPPPQPLPPQQASMAMTA